MKTRISQLAVALFFAISLISGNVNATEHDVKASSHENIEATLEFEDWMMDEEIWNTSTFHYTEATETNLELENWMVNDNIWEVESAIEVEVETEQELAMEPWMMNVTIWKI